MEWRLAAFEAAWPFNVISIHARLRLNEIHLSVERALYYHMPKVNWLEPRRSLPIAFWRNHETDSVW